MKLTVCEMPDGGDEFEAAWGRLSKHVRRESSDVVLLPEMPFYYWFAAAAKFDRKVWDEAVRAHALWVKRISSLGAPVVLGSRPVERDGRRMNQGFIWTKKGYRAVHHKYYLPDEPGFFESRWYSRGDGEFSPFEAGGWKTGLMLCTDMWSMPHARRYGKKGVDLVAVPRATPQRSVEKWIAGGKVAAVVSGAYCASSNRSGSRGGVDYAGRGWIIDPDGAVLGLTSGGRPFVTVDIDRSKAEKAKTTYPRYSLQPD